MAAIYRKNFVINYYEINKYQEATPITILNYLEETAISHSEAVGLGISHLKSKNLVWLLNQWILNIDRYPSWGEKVTIETWAVSLNRFYATRDFYIKNDKNNILGKASSLWVFFDIMQNKPVRIPEEIQNAYGVQPSRAIEKSFEKIFYDPKAEVVQEFLVRRSDIDTNNHVNNTKYVAWALEAIPEHIYDHYNLSSLEIKYKKESKYGTHILSSCCQIKDHFFHCIADKNGHTELAAAKTSWKRRQ